MDAQSVTETVILVRHTAVTDEVRELCYGHSDVQLSPAGIEHAAQIVEELANHKPTRIIHSGLTRTRHLAELIAQRHERSAEIDPDLRERDFGSWELRSWDDVYRETGDEMLKMITDVENYRPGGAETTREFITRVVRASQCWTSEEVTIVVTHGGVIATLLGLQQGRDLSEWPNLIPAYGEVVPYSLLPAEGK